VHSCKEILTAPSLTKADPLLLAVESIQPLNSEQFVIVQDVARPVVELSSIPEREIDKSIVDYAVDSNKFLSIFAKDGTIDWDKWTKVVAFAENPTQFMGELVKHGKSLGRKAMEAELKNATPNLSSKEEVRTNEFVSPFENPVEFLKGMTVRK
jgi:hypothetical protein